MERSCLSEQKKTEDVVEQPESSQLKQELEKELQDIRFMMKLCKDLRKSGIKNTYDLKKKYTNIYFRKLKLYCELCEYEFEEDLKQREVSCKIQEVKKDLIKIAKGGSTLAKLLKGVM